MSGGAGIGGAGGSGAGVSSSSSTTTTRPTPPWALKLDPVTRDFVTDANGRYVSVHPVEHEAMMRLLPAKGGVAIAPDQGGPWRDLKIDEPAKMTARMREHVQECWRPLLERGDLRIDRVSLVPVNSIGRARFLLEWTNLRDPQNPNRSTAI